jgi:hypothetical protein
MDRMVRDLRTASDRLMTATTKAAVKGLRAAVDSGFTQRVDVHGRKYIPAKDGHLPQMQRTGNLRRSYRYGVGENAQGTKIKVSEDTEYGDKLRDGAKMAPRQHMPQPDDPMPPRWDARVRPAIDAAIRREEARRS